MAKCLSVVIKSYPLKPWSDLYNPLKHKFVFLEATIRLALKIISSSASVKGQHSPLEIYVDSSSHCSTCRHYYSGAMRI